MDQPKQNIDEIFRLRLHDAEVPPPSFVWPAVESKLKNRRRRLFLWLFSFGVMASISACILLWKFGGQTNQVTARQVWQSTGEMAAPYDGTSLSGTIESPKEANPASGPSKTSQQISVSSQESTISKRETISKASGYHSAYLLSKDKSFKKSAAIHPEAEAPKPVDSEWAVSKGSASTVNTDVQPGIWVQSDLARAKMLASINKSILQPATNRPFVLPVILPKKVNGGSKRKNQANRLCYDFAHHPTAFLLDLYGGPSLAQRSLTSSPDNRPYLNQRLSTEKRNLAYNAGLRASFMFNQNLLIRTGLNYDQVTEVFEYIDPTYVVYTVKYKVINGQTIADTIGVEYGENYLKTYNRYIMVDVPLMVGIEMRQGRSGFSINAGISANVFFYKRGALIDPATGEPARFGPLVKNSDQAVIQPFRPSIGLSAQASIQWYYHLKPRLRVFAEPNFRQVLRPVTLSSHPVEQRYSILSLRLGVTKIF